MSFFGFGRRTPRSPVDIAPAAPAHEPAMPSPQPAPTPAEPAIARETPGQRNERGPHFPDALAAAEQELIRARRAAIDQGSAAPAIGMGLSGGGIRSATFCFGIFNALARKQDAAGRPLFTRIDYLSTVSGGGYFGSFLGALFRRSWVKGADDVAAVLRGEGGPKDGQRPARFLRDNGRYLAPRGSGDLLVMLAVMLRNWIAVQCVMVAFVLAAFLLLHILLLNLPTATASALSGLNAFVSWLPGPLASWLRPLAEGAAALAAMHPPQFGGLWWSGWFLVLIPIVLLWSVPTVWAYWVIDQPLASVSILRRSDLLVLAGIAAAALLGLFPEPLPRFVTLLALTALATTLWTMWAHPGLVRRLFRWIAARLRGADEKAPTRLDDVSAARRRVSTAFKTSLAVCGAIVVLALIDTLGATLYVLLKVQSARHAIAGIGAALGTFAGVAAYGRQLLVLFGGNAQDKRPRVSMSVLSWIVAVVVVGAWLVTINVGSHAITWQFRHPTGYPAAMTQVAAVKLTDAKQIVIEGEGSARTIKPLVEPTSALAPTERNLGFAAKVLGILAALIFVLGRNTFFINLSTMHTFYAQRLTRAYLGATNSERLCNTKSHVTDVIAGDDIAADCYWRWPRSSRPGVVESFTAKVAGAGRWLVSLLKNESAAAAPGAQAGGGCNGAPLHIVNVTINETFDNRTGIQVQDRKGVPLAIGPAGFSVGVRHHLVASSDPAKRHVALPAQQGQHCVFESSKLSGDPEVMSLGRWVSISGAAAGSAVGSRTTLPTAMLATFANVRLGYWWNSGLDRAPSLVQRLLPPVYRALLAEFLCNLRGTGDRLWNLSDGGHFENLGGYELIRRRLPLIILIDAEQDADYKFSGLADLIRKARLDFGAEIDFLAPADLARYVTAAEDLSFFGTLSQLRRVAATDAKDASGVGLEHRADRNALSRAHAAIAKVTYADGRTPPSWLVYVKATLTGDEPVDVLEYHGGHADFPHESTANQFFEEAQWESYRRLGEHIGSKVLSPAIFDLAGKRPDADPHVFDRVDEPVMVKL